MQLIDTIQKWYRAIQQSSQGATTLAVINVGTAVIEALKLIVSKVDSIESRLLTLENKQCCQQQQVSNQLSAVPDADVSVPEVQDDVLCLPGTNEVPESDVPVPKNKGRNTKNKTKSEV